MVSVIMPAYNAEKYIGKAIESILAQTYTDLELLIIEDASTDHTLERIKTYQDNRIRVFENSENMGISFSTNIGLRESRGEYVALMDDDDIAVKERLEIQVKYLDEHREIDILGGRSAIIDENGDLLDVEDHPRNNPKYIKSVLLFHCLDFRNGTTMMRSSFIKNHALCYRENCFGMQDYKFFIESSKVGNISSVDKVLLLYRMHGLNETQKEIQGNREERAEKYFEFQCDSLKASGFQLDEKGKLLIRKFLKEGGGVCGSYEEFKEFVGVLAELLKQAENLEVDYYKELEFHCRSLAAMQIIRMKSFNMELLLNGADSMKGVRAN